MFYLSRAIALVACLAAAIFADWKIGLIGLIAAILTIPSPYRRLK